MLWVQQRGPNLETCDQWIYKPTTILGFDPVKGKPTDYFRINKEITHFLILINQRSKL